MVDTTELVGNARGSAMEVARLQRLLLLGDELGISPIVAAEFMAGVRLDERPYWRAFLQTFTCWAVTFEDGLLAGEWQHEYRARGIQLALPDLLIAATAIRVGAVLLTSNVKDFPMPGLALSRE